MPDGLAQIRLQADHGEAYGIILNLTETLPVALVFDGGRDRGIIGKDAILLFRKPVGGAAIGLDLPPLGSASCHGRERDAGEAPAIQAQCW